MLLAPLQQGMLPSPHPMVEGMEERDYYQGKVTTATPGQREWAQEHADEVESIRPQKYAQRAPSGWRPVGGRRPRLGRRSFQPLNRPVAAGGAR